MALLKYILFNMAKGSMYVKPVRSRLKLLGMPMLFFFIIRIGSGDVHRFGINTYAGRKIKEPDA